MGVGLEWLERVAKQQERLKAQRKRIEEQQRARKADRLQRINQRRGWKVIKPQKEADAMLSLRRQNFSKWNRRRAKWDNRRRRWEARVRKYYE